MSESGRGFSATVVAGERFLAAARGDVRILFGLGPASGNDHLPAERGARLLEALGPSLRALRWCEQVHGRILASLADEAHRPAAGAACVGRCDGLVTAETGLGLLVWTADCVPLILVGDGVVAAVHSGWRGCAAGIATTAVRRLAVEYGIEPTRVEAFIGPAVGACHYPVGDEVIASLAALDLDPGSWRLADRVDLRALVRVQLEGAGLAGDRIATVGGCTACDPDLASYRRDGARAGRQLALVYRVSGAGRAPLS